jgi:glycosyltransferase involved in cell wall biosynthesis
MAFNLSVIICTHNPLVDYLQRVLDALKAQTLPKEQWELLVIDNASAMPLEGSWDLSWHLCARHIREDELGLTPARLRGIRESNGELIVFIDDDNVVSCEYLKTAWAIAQAFRQLGTFGAGQIVGEFAVEPAQLLKPYVKMVGLKSQFQDTWSNSLTDGLDPIGAGLCVRQNVARAYFERTLRSPLLKSLDRCGKHNLCHGDTDIVWLGCEMGYGKGVFRDLTLIHLIPASRIELDYLLELFEAHAFSTLLLRSAYRLPAVDSRTFGVARRLFGWTRYWRKSRFERQFLWAQHRGRMRAKEFLRDAGQDLDATSFTGVSDRLIPIPPV